MKKTGDIRPCRHSASPHRDVAAFLSAQAAGVGAMQKNAVRAARNGDFTALNAVRGSRGKAAAAEPDDAISVVDDSVPSASGSIPIRLYLPAGTTEVRGRPAVLYLHGGGWTIGGIGSCARFCRKLAAAAGTVVAAIDYRLAPEHPFPAAFEDTLSARRWLQRHAGADRVYLAGDSAGGNLAVAAALRTAQDPASPGVSGLILFYPVTYADADGSESWIRNGSGYALDAELMNEFNAAYATEDSRRSDPMISPILSASLSTLPPMLLVTAQYDILHDQGREFAVRAAEAGVQVDARCYAGASHLFISMPGMDVFFRRAVTDAAGFLNRRCG